MALEAAHVNRYQFTPEWPAFGPAVSVYPLGFLRRPICRSTVDHHRVSQ
jgi:hypothetical protein